MRRRIIALQANIPSLDRAPARQLIHLNPGNARHASLHPQQLGIMQRRENVRPLGIHQAGHRDGAVKGGNVNLIECESPGMFRQGERQPMPRKRPTLILIQ